MGKRCLQVCYFVLLLAFLVFLWNVSIIYFLEWSDTSANSSLEEDQDWLNLAALDPFKDMDEIKAIAHRRYFPRRAILKKACDNIKGK